MAPVLLRRTRAPRAINKLVANLPVFGGPHKRADYECALWGSGCEREALSSEESCPNPHLPPPAQAAAGD